MITEFAPKLVQEGVKLLRERHEAAVTEKALLFLLKEEIRYNLELMAAWRSSDDKFPADGGKALRICGHLRMDVTAIILSDPGQSKLLKSALTTQKRRLRRVTFNGEIDGETQAEKEPVDILLLVLRKVSILQVLAKESAVPEAGLGAKFRFNVRLKNIFKAYLELINILNTTSK